MSAATDPRVLVMVVGLNPLRILRAIAALRPDTVVVLTTPQTEHPLPVLPLAIAQLGLATKVQEVPGDAYLFQTNLDALLTGVGALPAELHWVIAGGTKPMVAAQYVAAAQLGGVIWTLDDRAGALVGAGQQRVAIPAPDVNLDPQVLAQLHAGLGGLAQPDRHLAADQAGRLAQVAWLRDRLLGRDHFRGAEGIEVREAVALRAELAVLELIRTVLPASYAVHVGQVITLRDPFNPSRPARSPVRGRAHNRTFEVDGLIIRGTSAWVVETKFRNLKAQQARVAAAELDTRRRNLAGDVSHGLLVVLNDGPRRPVSDDVPEFDFGDTRVIARPDLLAAADAALSGHDAGGTRLAGMFLGAQES